MTNEFKVGIIQTAPHVGALEKNIGHIKEQYNQLAKLADLIVTPEASLTGYPLDDLVWNRQFLQDVKNAAENLALATKNGPPILIGAPWDVEGQLYNAALLMQSGKIQKVIKKRILPNDGPFHEKRHFSAGRSYDPVEINGKKIGIAICEDIWDAQTASRMKNMGAEALIVMNASPYEIGKQNKRLRLIKNRAKQTNLPIAYINMVGGQDELVFDGQSFALNNEGKLIATCNRWGSDTTIFSLDKKKAEEPLATSHKKSDEIELLYEALVLAVRDYACKNKFSSAIIGMSGGIDSAVTAAIACDALGPENVHALMLGHDLYTSKDSHDFSRETCLMNGCNFSADHLITKPYQAMTAELEKRWNKPEIKETYENVQARLRTLFLFAVSNEENHLVLNTSNKTEVAMGHSTFYGDTSGGFAPLKDVWKLQVYELAKWRNANICKIGKGKAGPVVHPGIIERPPTPELGENEIDTDLLPPYDILDPILKALVEDEKSVEDIVQTGHDPVVVSQIENHLHKMQFKRFQTPPGPKVSPRSFGHRERLYPLTNGYRTAHSKAKIKK